MVVLRQDRVAVPRLALAQEQRGRAALLGEGRPVPEHRVAVLQRRLVSPNRRRGAVDLVAPAARAGARVEADLVDERAERGRPHVVVELAGHARRIERGQRVRPGRQGRLGGAEDRRRLALHAHLHAQGERRSGQCAREQRNAGQNDESSKHESSFREGFGVVRRRGRSSDSGLPPPPPSRPRGQWSSAEEQLPSQRRDRPGFAPGSLTACRSVDPIMGLMPSSRAFRSGCP